MNLEVFVSLLKKTLVRIDTAESGAECLSLSAKKKYDVIFLDHMMPDMDGIQTLQALKADPGSPNAGTPAVCLTANAISGARETYLSAGFDDYLTKPVEPEKLEEMLLSMLPEEKVQSASAVPAKEERSSVIPDFVRDIKEIDLHEGLRHSGTADIYLQVLVTYAATVDTRCDEIERYWEAGDVANMTVKVHAIKSTSRVIGAVRLGSLAEDLEAAGRANDTVILSACIGELLSRCRELGRQLAPLLHSDDLPLIPDDELSEAYALIRDFLSVSDYDGVLDIIDELAPTAIRKTKNSAARL